MNYPYIPFSRYMIPRQLLPFFCKFIGALSILFNSIYLKERAFGRKSSSKCRPNFNKPRKFVYASISEEILLDINSNLNVRFNGPLLVTYQMRSKLWNI